MRGRLRRFLVGFCLIHFFLSGFYLDLIVSPNPTSRVLPVLTVVEDHSLQIDRYKQLSNDKSFVRGHYYSDKAPLPSFLVIPFYGLVRLIRNSVDSWRSSSRDTSQYNGEFVQGLGDLLCGTVPFVFFLLVSLWWIRNSQSALSPVLLATLPFYSSYVFLYSGTFFGHNLAAAFLLGSYVCLKSRDRFTLSGYLLGASVLTEYTVAIIFPIWLVQLFFNEGRAKAMQFSSGFFPWVVLACIYNSSITGSPWRSPYAFHADAQFSQLKSNYGFNYPKWDAIWGLTLSPYRGLFFYAPVLVLMGYVLFRNREVLLYWRNLVKSYVASFSVCTFLLISAHFTWWGGWCYGPRYLINMTVLLLFEGLCLLSQAEVRFSKVLFYALSGFGLWQVWLAKSTVTYMSSEGNKIPLLDLYIPEWLKGNVNEQNILSLVFGVAPCNAVFIWLVCFGVGNWILVRWYKALCSSSMVVDVP